MANVNINRSVSDAFYRYKMPRIIAKVEGKGNGIKTVIVNMVEVAKALSRPPTYPTKYFGCELGAQTQFDHKNDRYIVNGAHDAVKLQDLLDGFITRFVLCPECDNPETNLTVLAKKGMIDQRCIACGHRNNVDMRHKLTTFILKNPPDQDPAAAGATTPGKKKDRKGKKGGRKDEDGNEVNGDASPEQHAEHKSADDDSWGEDEADWGEDVSDKAVQKRMLELTDAAKKLALSEDFEKTEQERLDFFYEFVKKKKEDNKLSGQDKEKEIVSEAERLEVKDKAALILAELLFDDKMVAQIKQYRTLFLRFTYENPKAQKYLLGGFEQLVGKVYKDTLLAKVPHILKAFYETDILDEDVIVDWDKKGPSKKYVSKEMSKEIHVKASPLIKWLKEAEEESEESEEDEEEEVEVVYSHTEKAGTVQTVSKETAKPGQPKEEEEDFDIDAI